MISKRKMRSNYPPIVSIGDLVADIVIAVTRLPVESGQHQLVDEIRLEPGGGANFLIAGSRLGYPMAAAGVLGDDEWGHQVAASLRAEQVDLAFMAHSGTTTTVIVLAGPNGEHVFLGKYGEGPALRLDDRTSALLHRAGAVYCAGYTLRETRLLDAALAALRQAHQAGIPVFFDPGPQMAEVPPELRRQVLPLVDTVLATEAELPFLVESGSVDELLQAGPQQVVVKRGAAGCAVYRASETGPVVDAPGYPVPVVDTSAAGDSFNAAFIVATLRGWPVTGCARLANAAGAAKVQKLGGGRSVPTLAEIRAVIDRFDIILPERV